MKVLLAAQPQAGSPLTYQAGFFMWPSSWISEDKWSKNGHWTASANFEDVIHFLSKEKIVSRAVTIQGPTMRGNLRDKQNRHTIQKIIRPDSRSESGTGEYKLLLEESMTTILQF
jgi:hypothetical protein